MKLLLFRGEPVCFARLTFMENSKRAEAYRDYEEWFRQEVQKGLAQLDRSEFVSHEEVVDRIQRILDS